MDLTPGITSASAIKLQHIFDIYGLNQLITEPTRVALNSCTLIDNCITNSPDKIAKYGAVHLAISDHALIYMTYKAKYERSGARIIKTRHIKNFHKSSYLRDLQQKAWSDIETLNDSNDMCSMWKDFLMQSIDKHAPLKSKRVGNKKALWITDHLRREMHKRDFLKKKAMLDRKESTWDQYKRSRNQTNNEIKKAKRKYFIDNLELSKSNPKKTWYLINELLRDDQTRLEIFRKLKLPSKLQLNPLK